MQISNITNSLTFIFKGTINIPQKIEKNGRLIYQDIQKNSPIPQTTSENVQNLVTSLMDAVQATRTIAGGLCAFSTLYYLHSHFSTISLVLSPITALSMLITGIITYDACQTYQTMKELNNWIIDKYPNYNDVFILNDQVYDRWREFTTHLKYRTWIVDPLARPYLEKITKFFRQIKIGFMQEQWYNGLKIVTDNTTDKTTKGWYFTLLAYSIISRVVSPPFRYIAYLWNKLEKKALS